MKKQQRSELKKRMQEEIDNLHQEILNMAESTGPVKPDAAIGRLSRLDTMLNQGINENAVSNAKQRILRLEAAIRRVDDDPEFGECEECGTEIPVARLLAIPESTLCVDCAE